MSEVEFYPILLWSSVAIAGIIFITLFFLTAPYGRHTRSGWGPTLNNTLGWVIMESPSVILFGALFLMSERTESVVAMVFLVMWELHYINRTFIFPFRLHKTGKRMPIVIMLSGVLFNCVNAYLNGRYLFSFGPELDASWLSDPRFAIGVLIFFTGMFINHQSDTILLNLRKPGETGYKIPQGGMYRYITCPNYFGECIEWLGFAIATWSLPALVFFIWTVANLAPRARTHHQWYLGKFDDYPKERRILLPFVW